MTLRWLRAALLVLGVFALIVIELVSAFADITSATRHQLALAAAGIIAALTLLQAPPTRPPAERRTERSPVVVALGRWLIRLLWLARSAAYAYAAFSFTSGLAETTFQARTAILAGTGQMLTLLLKVARHLAGFVVDWTFLRGLNSLRYLLGVAAAVLLAGYAGLLADIAETVVPWVPVHVYGLLREWGVWSWVAVPLAGLSFFVVVFVSVLVESVLQYAAARVLGRDNAVGSWLEQHLPARLVLTDTEYIFEYKFLVEFRTYGPRTPRPIRRRTRQRLARYEQPLGREEEQALVDRVADVLWADFPPRWTNFALTYRAAGRYEELAARLNVMSPPNERGVSVGEVREWELVGFAELGSLRRLRAAGYKAGEGTPFEWVLSFNAERGFRTDEGCVQPHDRAWWRPSHSYEEPEWFRPPAREDYHEDLRRFPIVRRVRPRWLRERLRGGAPARTQDTPAQYADTPA
jgi:hypothetical protein